MVTKKTQNESSGSLLARLAELCQVQTRYRDALGHVREPSAESLLKTLLALGAPVEGPAGLAGAVRVREAELWGRVVEPVIVAWEGELPGLTLRLPAAGRASATGAGAAAASQGRAIARLTLALEEGQSVQAELSLEAATIVEAAMVDGRSYASVWLSPGQVRRALGRLVGRLPWGHHRLLVEVQGVAVDALVISAPRRCWEEAGTVGAAAKRGAVLPGGDGDGAATFDAALAALAGKRWGVFAPVYALRSRRDWGAGDLDDLKALMDWTGQAGGSLVATLPLLASSFEDGADPSPYRPLSRLFWNEFFLSPEGTDEWVRCAPARVPWDAAAWSRRLEALRAGDLVDYEAVMALKRPALEELARHFFTRADSARWQDYKDYLAGNPFAPGYAAFRASGDAVLAGRPAPQAAGAQAPGEDERYHLYCQWQMDRQLAGLARNGVPGLLFDLPLGVHPQGFDVHRWPGVFAARASSGAPPDAFFLNGQDWTTPPFHPQADRLRGYPYFGACLRNLMRHASALRIDHMMSFHRLFWIPEGSGAKDGVYVTYPAEELYALLSCESHRSQTAVIGEDLGTVPPGVRSSMRRHAVARTSILLGTLRPRAKSLDVEVPAGALATLETHDMVPLAGFLHGDDIQTRMETGQLDPRAARREAAERRRLVARLAGLYGAPRDDPKRAAPAILAGALGVLARSAATTVLVNLEDLLLARDPQNVPGTGADRLNWRRKMGVPLEDLPRYTRSSK
jgi:4-alpha-glucanotransferase